MPDLASHTVTFVGAGPGAADHLTPGTLRALQQAEVVIHDRLGGAKILALIPATTGLIDRGKQGPAAPAAQSDINAPTPRPLTSETFRDLTSASWPPLPNTVAELVGPAVILYGLHPGYMPLDQVLPHMIEATA